MTWALLYLIVGASILIGMYTWNGEHVRAEVRYQTRRHGLGYALAIEVFAAIFVVIAWPWIVLGEIRRNRSQ